jgi:hypothetical protein
MRLVLSFACVGMIWAGTGCGGESGDNGDGGDGPELECEDPAYGDGTCDLDLTCDAPDIDCYIMFADEPEARTWFTGVEEQVAAAELRAPRALVPAGDARFTRMRALLDEGWQAYKEVNAVADLAPLVPELVVIEDPSINAFVYGDGQKVAFAVMVQTGIIDAASDEELIAVVMHELTHAIRLHVIPEMKERIRQHYLAPGDTEPFGFEQPDDATVRGHIADWRALAADVGALDAAPLVGFPMPNGNGTLFRVFNYVTKVWSEANPDICAAPLQAVQTLQANVLSYYSKIDQTLHLDGMEEALSETQNTVLINLRDQCMAGLTDSYITILADINDKTEQEIRDEMSDEDEALVEGRHFIEAMAFLGNDRRVKMRAVAEAFTADTGEPWSRARQYTTEEEADDATIPILTAMGRDPAGMGPGLMLLDDENTQSQCNQLLAGSGPPYGADLLDEHHANCWRVFHVNQLADSGRLTDGASALRRRAPAPTARPSRYKPLPYPPSPADGIMY